MKTSTIIICTIGLLVALKATEGMAWEQVIANPILQPITQPTTVYDTRGGNTTWTQVAPMGKNNYSVQDSDGNVNFITTFPNGTAVIYGQ